MTRRIARDARTGRFVTMEEAAERPDTTVVETRADLRAENARLREERDRPAGDLRRALGGGE